MQRMILLGLKAFQIGAGYVGIEQLIESDEETRSNEERTPKVFTVKEIRILDGAKKVIFEEGTGFDEYPVEVRVNHFNVEYVELLEWTVMASHPDSE